MKDATRPLQAACVAAIRSKLTTAGYSTPNSRVLVNPDASDTMPYVVVASSTGVTFPTKTTEGMECTASFTCWDDDPGDADALADYVLQALTDRDNPLSVTGFTTAFVDLDFRDTPIREENPPETYWGVPIRVRFRLVET